ncbi:MAG: ribbon-helix-helix domain-containing protein [Puniceicoccaceae bacterium]
MATRDIPEGTKNVTVNLPLDLIDDIMEQARENHVNRSEYIRAAILAALERGLKVSVDRSKDLSWVTEDGSQYDSGAVRKSLNSRQKPRAAQK